MQKIMFNDQYRLTKAVLGGWKTNTRRIIPQSVIDKAEEYRVEYYNQTFDAISLEDILIDVEHLMGHKSLSKYKVGEEIAVAQNYNDVFHIVDDNKRTIIDIGTYGNCQSYYFTEHERYIAVEPSMFDGRGIPMFQPANCEVFRATGQQFVAHILPRLGLDLNTTFVIMNYVPSEGCNKVVRDTFPNLFIYYPRMDSKL